MFETYLALNERLQVESLESEEPAIENSKSEQLSSDGMLEEDIVNLCG